VSYASGQAQVTDVDVVGAGFGSGWSHTRTYTNQMTGSQDVGNGFNWYLEDWPYLEQTTFGNGWLVLLGNANDLLWFELQEDSSWKTLYGRTEKLALSGGRLQLLYPNGTLVEFNSLTATSRPGQFVRKVSPGGVVTTVAEVLAPGSSSSSEADQPERILEVRRSVPQNDGTILTESFLYDFFESGVQLDRLQSCTLRRRITVPSSSSSSVPISGSSSSSGDENWDYVQRALYESYDSGDTYGSLGDLKRVERQNFDGTSWVHLDYRYYRYWTSGFIHGLKFRLDAAGWQNMVADGLDPLTATDAQLLPYSDKYFEYDSEQQVSRELVDFCCQWFQIVTFADLVRRKTAVEDGEPSGARLFLLFFGNRVDQICGLCHFKLRIWQRPNNRPLLCGDYWVVSATPAVSLLSEATLSQLEPVARAASVGDAPPFALSQV